MLPTSASTWRTSSARREKRRSYAPRTASYARSAQARSAWNEYRSFITNSRERSRPDRGRSSSRYLRPCWYRSSGRSRWECAAAATKLVTSSSAVGARQKSVPRRSLSRNNSGPVDSHRPVSRHSEAPISSGMDSLRAPIRPISSSITLSSFSNTRWPSGRSTYTPESTCLMKPPRTSSWCDGTEASAGASRRTGANISVLRENADKWRTT
mmetsp:Transcript_15925/g.50738  ORF Transcript_15925/g.50738 Transcript_15925/m.50738 type:complete len:211 (-) Transcript_15925:80-712(-)